MQTAKGSFWATLLIAISLVAISCRGPESPGSAAEEDRSAGETAARPTEADVDAIKQIIAEHDSALGAGEVDRMVSLVADDFVLMPPNQPSVVGKEAYRSWLKVALERFAMDETLSVEEVRIGGAWAAAWITHVFVFTPRDGGPPVREEGKGVALFSRQTDRSWKWSRAIWNNNGPPRSG